MERTGPQDASLEPTGDTNFEADRARLESEVAAAVARLEIANARIAARAEETREAVRELVLVSQRELADADRDHHVAIESIRAGAQAEAARIVAEARAESTVTIQESERAPTADAG